MTLRSLAYWRADGSPYQLARPVAKLEARLRGYGYTVYDYPDDRHLSAPTPEDHTPFSHTGWPVESPYGWGHALDQMAPSAAQVAAGLPTLAQVARQIIADRDDGVPGISWLKYINWTDEKGITRHERWQPDDVVTASSDAGHNHLSCRSDCTQSAIGDDYDPVARFREGQAMDLNTKLDRATGPAPGGSPGRDVGDHFYDMQGLRDWLVSAPTVATINAPPTGSRLDIMFQAAQAIQRADVPVRVTLDDATVAKIVSGVVAGLGGLSALSPAALAEALNGITLSASAKL